MAMSAEHRSKIAALHRLWWGFRMSLEMDDTNKQTNKSTDGITIRRYFKTERKKRESEKRDLMCSISSTSDG